MVRRAYASVLLLLLILVAGVFPASSQQLLGQVAEPKYGGTLVIAHWGDPKSFNPDAQVDDAGAGIFRNIFNQLYCLDYAYNPIPDLAYAYKVSEDGKTYTFYLHRNVTWHDGVRFTSKDVKWTFDAIKKFKGIARGHIKADNILNITTPDDYTVVFHLKDPYAPFVALLSWYGTWIMPAHIYGNVTDWLSPDIKALTEPIGTGPFKFVEWVRGSHVTLVANENYFKGRPYLDKIIFRIIPDAAVALQTFLAGEADVLGTRPELSRIPEINATKGLMVYMFPTASRWYIGINLQKPLFQDVRVRMALAYAINRTDIVDKAEAGYGVPAQFHYAQAVTWAVNPNAKLPPYDPKMAEKLLDEAGYPRGADGTRFTIRYTCWSGPEETSIGEIIKDNLRKVGIKVELEVLEFNIWEEKVVKKRDYDIALCDGFQGPDPANFILRVGGGQYINFAGYKNDEVDALFEQGGKETDQAKRKEIYWKIQEIVAKDMPYIWIVDLVGFGTWAVEKFHGMPWEPSNVGKVGIGNYERTWWEGGFSPLALDEAKAAIDKAEREGRTIGLEAAKSLYSKATDAFKAGDWRNAATYAREAISAAGAAQTFIAAHAIEIVAGILIVAVAAGAFYWLRKRKK